MAWYCELGGTVNQAARDQFGRVVDEFVRWREIPEDERSPAPAWWWGPAFDVRTIQETMPADWCAGLRLPEGSSCAAGAAVFLNALAEQTSLSWPEDFPRIARRSPD